MTRVYYKEAVGAFIVFDVTRADSFRAVDKWKADLDTKVRFRLFKSFFYVWKIKKYILVHTLHGHNLEVDFIFFWCKN